MSEMTNVVVPISVAKKLLAVMAEVGYIKKDKKNEFHKYNYVSEQAIKEALHPALVKHGLLFLPTGADVVSDIETINSKGNKERLMTIRYMYRFVDAESGEFMEGYALGTGVDSSDKSVYKATTGAIKYILTSTFLIPTGDDPERDAEIKGNGRQRQQAVADRKVSQAPVGATPIAAPAVTGQAPTPEALKNLAEMQTEVGEVLYKRILAKYSYKSAADIPDLNTARKIYKELGAVRILTQAAVHGEILPGVDKSFFFALPDSSRSAVFIELRKKIGEACGSSDTATEEYERLRENCSDQWEFFQALSHAHEYYFSKASA